MAAYHDGTDAGGNEVLDAFAGTRPVGVKLYATDPETLAPIHGTETVAVPPALPAERLATNSDLADRIRETAPAERLRAAAREDDEADAVANFLDVEARIAQLRSRAREEARERAERWGFETRTGRDSKRDGQVSPRQPLTATRPGRRARLRCRRPLSGTTRRRR